MNRNASPELLAAFREYDREMTIRKTRVGCMIGIILYPVFNILDHLVYPQLATTFLYLRFAVSFSMLLLYPLFGTTVGRKFYRLHGMVLLALPAAGIAWMVYMTGGPGSPYYAGLNIVLLVLAVVLDWTFFQSVTSVFAVLAMYLVSCALAVHFGVKEATTFESARWDARFFPNNMAFLISTCVIIIVAAYFHSRLRFSEFASRFELDRSRGTLTRQNEVLENTLRQLKETELQLIQTEKIVSLGRLSAGIIHEINNPLNFATTALYTLRQQGERLAREKPADFSEVLQDISDGLQRVKNIVADLRSFTHPDATQIDDVQLSEVVNTSLRFLSNEWRDRVVIEQNVPADLVCRANRNKLMQVFVNLIQNALDALKSRPESPEPPRIVITGSHEEGRCFVRVRDNGEGIDPQNLSKIFDPFFTTRDVGKGMGMGLSICYRIVSDCHGQISVKSEKGKFCEFTVALPSANPESAAA